MFKRNLGETVLVFAYPHAAPRLFHTFCCPPLRVIALEREGETVFDQVIPRGRFVRLPATQIVIETDPNLQLSPTELRRLARTAPETAAAVGAWQVHASLDRLLFALLREAVADIRRVHEAHSRNGDISAAVLQEKFPPWERGQFTGSAGFILDFSAICEVPETAVRLSHQILKAEAGWLDEITAAALAGAPWKGEFPDKCLRCNRPALWRPVLEPPAELAPETAWRYERPENHFLLCRRCANWLGWQRKENLRLDLAQGLWGVRFDALQAWQAAAVADNLPSAWERQADPLWPPAFGGETWETGSGARAHAEPRLPTGVDRTEAHWAAFTRALNGRGGIQRKRGRGQFAPWQPFLQLAGISPGELT
jgi:hypothetical protein